MSGWFAARPVAPGVTCLTEPAVHDFYRANIHLVRGRDADLVVDTGTGVAPLLPALGPADRPRIAVATHAHVDHAGGLHAFAQRLGPAAEAEALAGMDETATLQHWFRAQTAALSHPPSPGFALADWRLTPAPLTRRLAEGDRIDLGDRRFTVLHLPGHSPGSLGLIEERTGLFLTGDAIYADTLVDDLPGSDIAAYCATMERLRTLDVALCLGGHGEPFDRAGMVAIAETYLRHRAP
jgi:glyoxylase-like metal-dependent hydrolase (beta-lactamase superfamily II)